MKKALLSIALLGNLAVIIAAWWIHSGALLTSGIVSSELIAIGRMFGLLAELLILVQLSLIGRIRFIEQLFGFDKLNRVHRLQGYFIASLILIHPTLLTIGYALSSHTSLWSQFLDFLTNWEDVFKAFLGAVLLLSLVGISISIIRKKLKYETWYFAHLGMYVAIFLFFGHQVNTADMSYSPFFYYWYVLNFTIFGLVLLYRFIRPLYLAYKHQFVIDKIVPENDVVTSIYVTGKNMEKYRFHAGQYVHVIFLKRGMWYAHPFSISSAPNGKYIRLSVKSSGDFTNKINMLTPGTKMIIDGPFGIFTERNAKTNKFLFIAAGIGITPIYSLIESMASKNSDIELLYGNSTEKEAVFLNDLARLNVKTHTIFSQEKRPGSEEGRIDREKIVRLVPDFAERDIYICGPLEMIEDVRKALHDLNVPPRQIHFERFNY